MGRSLFFLTLFVPALAATFWANALGSVPVTLFGFFILCSLIFSWILLAWSEREFNRSVDLTADINNNMSPERRQLTTEPDPRYEDNSGLRRMKNG